MLPLVASAIKEIFHNPDTIFIRVKVMDLLFRGVDVDCSSQVNKCMGDPFQLRYLRLSVLRQEFAAVAVCSAFETEAEQMKKVNDHTFQFSFFASVRRWFIV